MPRTNFTLAEFETQTCSEAELSLLLDFDAVMFRETHPDDPPRDRTTQIKEYREPPFYEDVRRFVMWDDLHSMALGTCGLSFITADSPEYEENKHNLWSWISVLPSQRRRGRGTHMLEHLSCVLADSAAAAEFLECWIVNAAGKAFVERSGGWVLAQEDRESRLPLNRVDWNLMQRWLDEGSARAPGVTIELFSAVPDQIIAEYCEMYTAATNLMPRGATDWTAAHTPAMRREWERRTDAKGGIWITAISREQNGAISGMTEILYNGAEGHIVHQELTGVLLDYRGRGLGKWLKAHMLFYIKRRCPRAQIVATGNAHENAPMLSINERMGFQPYRNGGIYRISKQSLAESLQRA